MRVDTNPPLRSIRPAANIPGFFDAVGDAIKQFQTQQGVPDGTTPTYVHAWPKARLAKPDDPFDVITFRVLESTMAPMDNAGNRVPRSPQLRETKSHPDMEHYSLRVYGWWELVKVEFTIWSRSNARADAVTDWLHRLIMKYAFAYKFFRARGVDYFRFVSRHDDDIDLQEGQELYKRRLTYEIRLETLDAFETKDLETADVNIGINRDIDSIELSD